MKKDIVIQWVAGGGLEVIRVFVNQKSYNKKRIDKMFVCNYTPEMEHLITQYNANVSHIKNLQRINDNLFKLFTT